MNGKISLSFVYKFVNIILLIVLQNFLLDCGMGIFGCSLIVYFLFYTIFFGYMYETVDRIVSIRNGKGNTGSFGKVVKPMIFYVIVISVVLTIATFAMPDKLSEALFGVSYPVPVIGVLCVIFLVNGISDILCGYHKANKILVVWNISMIMKIVLPILFSLICLRFFVQYGTKVAALIKNPLVKDAYVAMGIAFVYLLTNILVFFVVIVLTIIIRKGSRAESITRSYDSGRSVMKNYISIHGRRMLNNLFTVLSVLFVTVIYFNIVSKTEITIDVLYANVGAMFTKLLLPFLVVLVIFMEYVNREMKRLHSDYRKDDIKNAMVRSQYMIKNSVFMLIPPSLIIAFLSKGIAKSLFNGTEVSAVAYMNKAGFVLLFAGLAYVMKSILKAYERDMSVIVVEAGCLVGQILFVAACLSKNSDSMIVLYSFYLYFGLQIVVFGIMSFKTVRMDLLDILFKIGKYGVAGIVVMILFIILDKFISMNIFLLLLSVVLGYIAYYLTLLALRGISKKDEASLKRTVNYFPVHFLRSRLRL